jgi:hypothetical protein
MRVMKPFVMVLCLGVALLSAPLAATADDWNKETSMTFNQPVEIPGMVLAPGTYVFKLLDSPSDRSVVQVFSADESHLYEDVLVIPAYRSDPADRTTVTFQERPKGTPEAIKDWFYPGDNYGQEFVYPEMKVAKVAALPAQKSIVTSGTAYAPPRTRSESVTPEHQAKATAAVSRQPSTAGVTPKNIPVPIAQSTTPPKPAAPSVTAAPAPLQKEAAKKLPKTASPVPVLILIGLLSLGASATAQRLSKRCV